MGLAQRKEKQRIGYDPRNLTWANDKDRFSLKHMNKLGWAEGSGIGKDQSGRATHIAVMRKMDNTGIGMGRAKKEGEELSAGAGQAGAGLEDVLKRLASRKNTPTTTAEPSPAPTSAESSPGPSTIRNKMASRQRHLHSKRLASQSPAALAEILGVPVSSLPATPTESPAPSGASTPAAKESSAEPTEATSAAESDGEPQRLSLETITTSKMSVSDYFRQKLREKALARQAASGSNTPVPTLSEGSLAIMKEEVKITQDGIGWEGTKMKFEEVQTELVDLGGDDAKEESDDSSASKDSSEPKDESKEKKSKKSKGKEKASDDDEKAAKKARKEEKRSKKEKDGKKEEKKEKSSKKEDKEDKRRRKEEKRAEKEAKKEGKKDKKRKRDEEGESDEGKKRKSKKD